MEHRIQYLREANGQNVGAVAIKVHNQVGNDFYTFVEYNVSVVNPLDRFDRAVARQLALGRLVEGSFTVRVPVNPTMFEISRAVMKDIARDSAFPSRARRAAKVWIRNNTRDL